MRVLYEWTDNELFAEATSFILGTPIELIIIGVRALALNAILRKNVRRLSVRLGKVTAEHCDSVVTDRSVTRAEKRASTIGSLLRASRRRSSTALR